MYMYMCVYVYIYIYIYTYTCIHIHIYTHKARDTALSTIAVRKYPADPPTALYY